MQEGASGFSGGFSIENSARALEVHRPTKQLDEVYEDKAWRRSVGRSVEKARSTHFVTFFVPHFVGYASSNRLVGVAVTGTRAYWPMKEHPLNPEAPLN